MTREHRAWDMLMRRVDYLNQFGGNKSELEKFTNMIRDIWRDCEDDIVEDKDFYPVENIGFDNSAVDCVQVQELKFMNESGIGLDEFDTESFIRYLAKKAEELDRRIENEKQKNG